MITKKIRQKLNSLQIKKKINESNSKMLELSCNKRKEMKDMLLKIMESFDKEPLRKKRKLP